jgi:hypothetical protein
VAAPEIIVLQAKGASSIARKIEQAQHATPGYRVFAITEARDGGFTAFLRHVKN